MSMTDPISDMMTRIRNANRMFKPAVDIPSSRLKVKIAEILKDEGFITDYKVESTDEKPCLKIFLKYTPNRIRALNGMKRISKPGLRVYVKRDAIPKVLGGLGIAILSTPDGLMTDKLSRKKGVGGEVICYVW
ncbi:MAG: 30S ribosomal protein S8 [Candidatus Wallbacteria bacterium]|nr:30S ribosomal protein S8 [Candidatus Wallbacteria bacterium]MBI4867796.1 30S ribosomal protein S8 [Candidatus Wallbacteria bacterium]